MCWSVDLYIDYNGRCMDIPHQADSATRCKESLKICGPWSRIDSTSACGLVANTLLPSVSLSFEVFFDVHHYVQPAMQALTPGKSAHNVVCIEKLILESTGTIWLSTNTVMDFCKDLSTCIWLPLLACQTTLNPSSSWS